jgi:activator of HSP90 ATPase
MIADPVTRREFAAHMTTCFAGLGLVGTAIGSHAAAQTPPSSDGEIIRTAEAIHQEVVFKATRQRVYEVLTDEKQFGRVVRLSAAMQSGMPPEAKPAEISRELGGAFSLFAGHIVGRQIELAAGERLVQAWRVVDWKPGVYSIAAFQLIEQGGNTKLVFDHTGFPKGQAQHLADGWKGNYWEPMAKVLA